MIWMNVKQTAKYLGLSEVMIYKLAQQGEIPCAKIASTWRFSQEQLDEWLLAQNQSPKVFPAHVQAALQDLQKELKKTFPKNFRFIVVFGSYARGDFQPDSDLDVLLIFSEIPKDKNFSRKVHEIVYDCSFEKGRPVLLATITMDEHEYSTGFSPLLLNVRKEGKRVA